MPPPNPLIAATVDHLSRFMPFESMAPEHLIWLAERLKVDYFAKGEVVMTPEEGPVKRLLIIKQGVIVGEQPGAEAWIELQEGESFPLGALMAHRSAISVFRAQTDVFAYELSAENFHDLVRMSDLFHDFCTRRIAILLEKSQRGVQASYASAATEQQSLRSPLSSILRRTPVTCAPDTPLRQALEIIRDNAISSIVVVEDDSSPVGVFTVRDLIGRVILPGTDLSTPMRDVMTPRPIALSSSALAFQAAILMARHGFRHVLVADEGRLTGVVSEKDLFSLQRLGVTQISGNIRAAADLEALKQAAADTRQLAQNMMAQGVAAEQMTQIISILNDLLTCRIIELEQKDDPAEAIAFCWLALGSEGRLEQTLNTDQDNGIIFDLEPGQDPNQVRATLLPFARRVNEALAACGFPLCNGEVMASNPKWCLSLDEWKSTFDHWIYHGEPMALLYSTIFFDFRPLFGADHLAKSLRDWLKEAAPENSRFLHQLAANAVRNRPPLGLVREFVTGEGHTIDLKLNGLTPFVDAARIYALAHGVTRTNTLSRLRDAAEAMNTRPQDARAWSDAFLFIQTLRIRLHHEQGQRGEPLSNKIDPDSLGDLDRRILKEAFRQARKLQTKLEVDYQL